MKNQALASQLRNATKTPILYGCWQRWKCFTFHSAFTFYMLAAWSPIYRWVPASGIRNPQTSSEQQAEQQRKLQIQMSLPPMKRCQWKAISPIPLILPSRVTREGRGTQISHEWHRACKLPTEARGILRGPESFENKDYTKPAKIHRVRFTCLFSHSGRCCKATKGHKTFGRLRKQNSSGRMFFLAWRRVETTGIPPSEFIMSLSLCAEIKSARSILPYVVENEPKS